MASRRAVLHCPILLVPALCLLLSGCFKSHKSEHYTIGFSQCIGGNWRQVMLDEMKRELSFYPDVTLLYREADGNTQKQEGQVKELLAQHIDLLIISPNEAEPLTPVVNKAFNAGIPVIVIDRKIASSSYTAYVGGDNYEVGRLAGEYAVHLLKGSGSAMEIELPPGSSPAAERQKGFADAIKKYPSILFAGTVNGELLKQHQDSEVADIVGKAGHIDLIFAQNDFLALKISNIYKNKHLQQPEIIGVDGLPGKDEGMQLVSDKTITATMLYPTGGEEAVRIALSILHKEKFNRENLLQTIVIDSANVRIMQLQAAKAASLQTQNERQQALLSDQRKIYNSQRTFVYILISSLVLALSFGGIAFYSLRENRKINKKLQRKNREISDQKTKLEINNQEILNQKAQLEIMSEKANAANEAKVNFFTNITHEFRTPLTLILGPLEEMMGSVKNQQNISNLTLIQRNVMRLLRLVNQLMDFRKIEVDKMKIRTSENDLVSFVSQIVQSFTKVAQKRNIDLQLITHERQLNIWIDILMMDKVLYNLLSNAFKFTKDGGYIYVHVSRSENEAIVQVEDNGIGMSEGVLEHVFELFYQGEYERYEGSGLGLALSRELILLHKGSITAHSIKGSGTTFEIRLLLGNDHLEKEEMIVGEAAPYTVQQYDYFPMTEKMREEEDATETVAQEKEFSMLIIEDNKDLRSFLRSRLTMEFNIYEADNSQAALQQAFDIIPDLILCDVVMPGKNGIELTGIFKNDIRTSHIPVILLTAKTSLDQQIEGMKNKADAYITKPFNPAFLEETIRSLLANRLRLKDHFNSAVVPHWKTQTIGKLDRKFINEFTTVVEANLSNMDFSVDDICKAMLVSKGLLYKKVKTLLKLNVNEYILDSRIQKAKYLLQHEELTISEIAFKVGFSSPTYFSTVFKNKLGVTPTEFKGKLHSS